MPHSLFLSQMHDDYNSTTQSRTTGLLTKGKERQLANLVRGLREIGHVPTLDVIRGLARTALASQNSSSISINWYYYTHFKMKYPQASAKSIKSRDYRRVQYHSPQSIDVFFNVLLSDVIRSIPPSRRYSMCALRWYLKDGEPCLVVDRLEVDRFSMEGQGSSEGNAEWAVAVECISATREIYRHLLSFPPMN